MKNLKRVHSRVPRNYTLHNIPYRPSQQTQCKTPIMIPAQMINSRRTPEPSLMPLMAILHAHNPNSDAFNTNPDSMYVRPDRYMCLHPLPQRPCTARSLGRGCRGSGLPRRGWVGGLLDGQGCGLAPRGSWLLCRCRGGCSGCFPGVGASAGRFLRGSSRGCR